MAVTIREIAINDVAAVIELMREFAEYEELGDLCSVTEDRLRSAMFGSDAVVKGLIAFDETKAVAYALFYPRFSSFRGERGLFLEDIYILDEYRRDNLGEQMLREIARRAKESGGERIDFHVLDWNTPAVNFYLKHGAEKSEGESHYKFAGEAFDKLVR